MNVEADQEHPAKPWQQLADCLGRSDAQGVRDTLRTLESGETARIILRLGPEDQSRLLALLEPQDAANVVREVGDELAADVMEDLAPAKAAAILDRLPSDDQADVLGQMSGAAARDVLARMVPAEAEDAKRLLKYGPDTAGGLMVTEYLSYGQDRSVGEALADVSANRGKYADYDVQYIYVTDQAGRLAGVVRARDLLFAARETLLRDIMSRNPRAVAADVPLETLQAFFDESRLLGAPVTDSGGHLLGVVLPEDVEEAGENRTKRQFLRISGIIAGEELRSMPVRVRAGRRLSWLGLNIVLNIIAASVIALYQDTIQAAIALAVFLPIISDMSGCSGNQAVAVSIRELALGAIRPREILRVLFKESSVGVINGLALGVLLGAVAVIWKGNFYLGMVIGGALAVNTFISVCLGGALPLLLRRLRIDPALLSGPILTTVTDTCGFFLTLSMATMVLSRLATG